MRPLWPSSSWTNNPPHKFKRLTVYSHREPFFCPVFPGGRFAGGTRAAGRFGCAETGGLRPPRRLRRRACGPPCPLHHPAKATGSWCFPAGQAFRRFVFSHLPQNLRWNCSQALWYNLNEKTDRQAENLWRCLYDAPKGIDRSAGTGIPSVWLLHLFWEEI